MYLCVDDEDYREAWRFLEEEYYNISLHNDQITRQQLGAVKQHLVKFVTHHKDGWRFRGPTLGRVKYILGDPIEEVLECFENALSKAEIPKDFVAIYQQYGLFYEILGPGYPEALQEAYRYHMEAISTYEKNKATTRWPAVSIHSKRCLDNNVYLRESGW